MFTLFAIIQCSKNIKTNIKIQKSFRLTLSSVKDTSVKDTEDSF